MPKYVLHYLTVPGRAFVSRLLFHHASVQFEDHQMQYKGEEFQKFKQDAKLCPFGLVPTLEVEGEVIAESKAISGFLATEFGLYGMNNLEKAKNDMLIEGFRDIISNLYPRYFRETDEDAKAALKKKFFEEDLPKGLKIYEERFAPANDFFVGYSITLSDISFFAMIWQLENLEKGILKNFPKLQNIFNRVRNSPNIKKYMDSLQQ